MNLRYEKNPQIELQEFTNLLKLSSLGERRPIDDLDCMEGMLRNANLTIAAYADDELVGIARSVTDFHYCCYLSDLAVHESFQRKGIGRKLQELTQAELGPKCKLILIAAPAAQTYYEHIGFKQNPRCWVLERDSRIR